MNQVPTLFLIRDQILVVKILFQELVVAHLEYLVAQESFLTDFFVAFKTVLEGYYLHFSAFLEEFLKVFFEIFISIWFAHFEHFHQ